LYFPITGVLASSDGDALISGYSIKNNKRQAKLLIGYCPQFDALSLYLTPEEHLAFFCRVRGITGSMQKEIVNELIKRLQLTKHRKKLAKSLSGKLA
jgi:ABC-type multidrug transport system ATPase subunit